MRQKFTKEVRIGIVTVVSLALLYIGINYLKGINLFKPVNHYYVAFDNVEDLTVSSPVFVEGFKVGLVRSMVYDYAADKGKITVEISLDKDMRINRGSYITLTKSLLGGAQLHLSLNRYVSEYFTSGDEVEGRLDPGMMQSVQKNILPGIEALLPRIDSILIGLQAIVNHPALEQSLSHIERTTGNLETSTTQLNLMLDQDMPVIMQNLKTMTGNFSEVSSHLKSLDIATTINTINQTLANLKQTTDKLHSSDNSMGLLLNDRTFYDNLNGTANNASLLLQDLREHPKRYVHFSLFGSKK